MKILPIGQLVKTNPIQTQKNPVLSAVEWANFKGKKMTVTDFNLLINFGQIIFMETLKSPPLFIRVTHILSFLIECIICRFKGILRTVVPNTVTSVRKTHFLGTNTTGPDYGRYVN